MRDEESRNSATEADFAEVPPGSSGRESWQGFGMLAAIAANVWCDMNENRSTIWMLERMADAKNRAKEFAARVNEQVTYALSGGGWKGRSNNLVDPAPVRLLDAEQPADCAVNDQS